MKIAFYSNYLNHHQLPFCLAMDKLTHGEFTFVATTTVPEFRKKLGYHDMNKQYPFVLTTYDSEENMEKAKELALSCDFIITGSAPEMYTKMRIMQNKLTFRYSERIYKRGKWRAFRPRHMASMLLNHVRYRNKPLYMLCASAYTAADFNMWGAYRGKTYKWGYFPEVKRQNDIEQLMELKHHISILWVARLIELKHPEMCICLAERLKKAGYRFQLSIIGNGEMEDKLRSEISERRLDDCVYMLGAMSPEEVREHMEMSDIFLFTSDFQEGWGAVLNEAMNSACAVVASHAIGSVPFLIEDGENGFIYKNGDIDNLYSHVIQLIEQTELRKNMGKAAYQTLADTWNADVAAERLINLAENLLAGNKRDIYDSGPCSKAYILKNDWFI